MRTNGPHSLFTYPGSKQQLTLKLLDQFPDHDTFVSVFGGSGAELLAKPPSKKEVFNDLDHSVWSAFTAVRDQPDSLGRLVSRTPARHERVYEEALKIVKNPSNVLLTDAWAFLVATHQSRQGRHPARQQLSQFCALRVKDNSMSSWTALPNTIESASDRLADVQIRRKSWETLIPKFDSPRTLFLLDPPYLPERHMYRETMSEVDHKRMLEMLQRVKGHVILYGSDTKLYRNALSHWRLRRINCRSWMSPDRARRKRIETIWFNYDRCGRRRRHRKGMTK